MRISDWSSDVCSSDLAPCAFSLLRDPEFPPGRRGEKAQHRLTLFHQRDGHRPSPPSAQIIARAVNRVDDPYAFVAKPHQIVRRLFRKPGRPRINDGQPFPPQAVRPYVHFAAVMARTFTPFSDTRYFPTPHP